MVTNTKISGPTIWTGQRIGSFVSTAVSYAAQQTDEFIVVTAAGQTITLPSAVGIAGQQYTIKLVSGNLCTVVPSAGQTIDGQGDCLLVGQWSYVRVLSDGANWIILGNGGAVQTAYYANLY